MPVGTEQPVGPESNSITRRGVLKRIALVAASVTVAGVAGNFGWKVTRGLLNEHPSAELLAEHDRQRPRNDEHWFTPSEYELVTALAAVIIPSDGNGPGAIDAGVVDQIDRMLAHTPQLQETYSRGLLAFDRLVLSRQGKAFVGNSYEQQVQLWTLMDEANTLLWAEDEPQSVLGRLERKANYWYYFGIIGISEASLYLFNRLTEDVTAKFYSSKIAWDWLGYEGPPFPLGYAGRNTRCEERTHEG